VRVDGLWQQKHPTPSGSSWEYHWHPAGLAAAVRAELAALDLGLGGGGESALVFGEGWLAWVRSFAAAAPAEQRAYVGLAGVVCHADAGDDWSAVVPGLLASVGLPPAAPWDGAFAPRSVAAPVALEAPVDLTPIDAGRAEALARLVVGGGRLATGPAAGDARLPALIGRLLAWLPPVGRAAPRRLVFVAADGARDGLAAVEDSLAHYLARAWTPLAGLPAGYPQAVWRLCAEAAGAASAEALFAELAELAAAWGSGTALAQHLRAGVLRPEEIAACDAAAPAPLLAGADAGLLFCRVLHHHGRGLLEGAGLEERLARLLALRVVVDHLVRLDDPGAADLPGRHLRRARYEALLPERVSARLIGAARRLLPSLGATP
jgi:hypothetical protein